MGAPLHTDHGPRLRGKHVDVEDRLPFREPGAVVQGEREVPWGDFPECLPAVCGENFGLFVYAVADVCPAPRWAGVERAGVLPVADTGAVVFGREVLVGPVVVDD